MRRSKRVLKRPVSPIDEQIDSESPPKKVPPLVELSAENKRKSSEELSDTDKTPPKKLRPLQESSSDESDIENYLQPADQIDLSSTFFKVQPKPDFAKIETNIFSGVTRLSDSDSDDSDDETLASKLKPPATKPPVALPSTSTSTNLNFQQLENFSNAIADAKRHVEQYEKKKAAESESVDILNLLRNTENGVGSTDSHLTLHSSDFESCDSEAENWEEVASQAKVEKETSIIPVGGVEITVQMPSNVKNKKKVDLLTAMKRRLNRVRKENQVLVHKVHLLCWLAHGNYVNGQINAPQTLALALALLPSDQCYPPDRTDLNYLEQIVKWYTKTVARVEQRGVKNMPLVEALELQIGKKRAFNKKMYVYIFIAILRSLGIQCRLVLSFLVEPLRPPASDLHSLSAKVEPKLDDSKKVVKEDVKAKKDPKSAKAKKVEGKIKEKDDKVDSKNKREAKVSKKIEKLEKIVEDNKKIESKVDAKNKSRSKEPKKIENSGDKKLIERPSDSKNSPATKKTENKIPSPSKKPPKEVDNTKLQAPTTKRSRSTGETRSKSTKQPESDSNKLLEVKKPATRSRSAPKEPKIKSTPIKVKLPNLKKLRNPPQVDGPNDSSSSSESEFKDLHKRKLRRRSKPPPIVDSDSEADSSEEFLPDSKFETSFKVANKKTPPNLKKLRKPIGVAVNSPSHKRKVKLDVRNDVMQLVKKDMASQKPRVVKKEARDSPPNKRKSAKGKEDDSSDVNEKNRINVWVEVFLESEEKWISVDVVNGKIHCVSDLYAKASRPVGYIVAWNNTNQIKDITKRYCQNFNTATRKLRIDPNWWAKSLKPFRGLKTARDIEEDDELERQQLEKPLPTSISEYKNHPHYVLRRHLLKFEDIYPPDAVTLGFVRKEPVYSRSCVYTLHSRDIWLKQAKTVKRGELPYKIVKARPKYDKLSNSLITDQLLEIFGPWQVEDYVPPTAENGVVPRNAFGNVDLFKECMLPKKCAHLKLPGLNKVAKRMNIDCASAIVAFDFHGGWSHPVYDGFVVCEEFAEILTIAWEQDQEEMEKKDQEKYENRVYGNWKKLIRGLLIKQRLKNRYNFGEGTSNEAVDAKQRKKKSKKPPTFYTKK